MPYIFIWRAYAFRDMDIDYNITKIDQGCIKKYFGSLKRIRGHIWRCTNWGSKYYSSSTKKIFCYFCQIQFKTAQEINQHKSTKKHNNNVFSSQTKFLVGDDIIKNKDYDDLTSEKGWLSDPVSYSN